MESMETGHYNELVANFIVALADGAHFVFLTEVLSVCLCERLEGQRVEELFGNRRKLLFIELE
jgi:hypothetical protein